MGFIKETCVRFLIFLFVVFNVDASIGEEAIYEKYVDEIVNPFVRDVKNKYGLVCIASGGTMPRNVERISLRFNFYQKTSLEEARELIIKLKAELISRVNAHQKIRPFLKEYPFTWVGADIAISFYKPKTVSHYLDGSVAFVCSGKLGKEISYSKAEIQMRHSPGFVNPERGIAIPEEFREREVLVPLLKETCEEAARIVHSKDKRNLTK